MRRFIRGFALGSVVSGSLLLTGRYIARQHFGNKISHSSPARRAIVLAAGDVPYNQEPPIGRARRKLFDAICWVETSNEINPPPGAARERGPYQIQKDYWDDACEYANISWPYEFAEVRKYSEYIMGQYWLRYGATTDEQRARMHNGGPSMRGTDEYWSKVQGRMNNEQ